MSTSESDPSIQRIVYKTIHYILDKLDIIGGLLGTVSGTLIIILSTIGVLSQYYIGFTIVTGSITYLLLRQYVFRRGQIEDKNEDKITNFRILSPRLRFKDVSHSRRVNSLLASNTNRSRILNLPFFLILILAQILWYISDNTRPDLYFILIAAASAIIGLEIAMFQIKGSVLSILLKIMYISFILRSGIFLNYPSVMGADAFTHIAIAEVISNSNFIPPFEISDKYLYYPILHIFIAISEIISSVDIKTGVLISVGLISIIVPTLFIYLLGKNLCNSQVGLLGALLFNLTNVVIVRGITNITTGSMVLCYFLILLNLIYRNKTSYVTPALLTVYIVLIIMTHQLTTFVVLLALGCILLVSTTVSYLHNNKEKMSFSLTALALFGVLMLFYWSITEVTHSGSFFEAMVRAVRSMAVAGGAYGADKLIVGQQYNYTAIETLILQSHYLIIPLLVIPGVLLWISFKDSRRTAIGISTGVLYIIAYGIPLLGIRSLLTGRWLPILAALAILPISDFIIKSIRPIRLNLTKLAATILLISFFSLIMITTPTINRDNPLVSEETTVRDQYTHSEIQAAKTTSTVTTGDVGIDSAYIRAYRFYGGEPTVIGKVDLWSRITNILEENEKTTDGTLYILRECTLREPVPVKQSDLYGDTKNIPLSENLFNHFRTGPYNLIYHNEGIYGYLPV
jgi:hypothetical protein